MVSLLLLGCGLDLSSVFLLSELFLSDLLLLHLVDGFDEDRLVLELVTLGSEVEMMIDIRVDLLGFSILSEESSENSLSTHPEDLGWHSGVSCSLSLSSSVVSALSLGLVNSTNS